MLDRMASVDGLSRCAKLDITSDVIKTPEILKNLMKLRIYS